MLTKDDVKLLKGVFSTKDEFRKELAKGLDQSFEKQAVLINNAFQSHSDHFDKIIADMKKDMDASFEKVENRLDTVESKIDRALYAEAIHIETRLKRVEQKLGIETAK